MNIKDFKVLLKFIRGNTCPYCRKGKLSVRSYLTEDRIEIEVKCTECPTETIFDHYAVVGKEPLNENLLE